MHLGIVINISKKVTFKERKQQLSVKKKQQKQKNPKPNVENLGESFKGI